MARRYNRLDAKVSSRIANNIKKFRKKNGMSQTDLCVASGVGTGNICHVEQGRITNPSLNFIVRVSKALKVTPSELTGLRL